MTNILVTIIIPVYNDWQRLSLCLDALIHQTFSKNEFEIIIVNNNANDTTPSGVMLPDNAKLITESKPGSYAARNAALKIAKGSMIGFTDSDCIPDENWIKYAVKYFAANPECSRIAGSVIIFRNSLKSRIEIYDTIFAFPQKTYVNTAGTSITANLFTYKHVFEKAGYFDEALMSGGDYLWGTLANKRGFKIDYVEKVRVKHPARASLKELINKEKRVGRGQGIFLASKANSIKNFYNLLKDLKPRLGDIKFIFTKKEITVLNKIYIFLLRQYLLAIRSYNKFVVKMGNLPNKA